jgi:HEAT repeat protein
MWTSRVHARRQWLAMAVVLAAGGWQASAEPMETFSGAKWIWYSREPMPASIDFPAGAARFRGLVELPAGTRVETAVLSLTADNLWLVHVNGKIAAAGELNPNSWNRARSVDVSNLLHAGRNIVAVEAVNTAAGPAGLLASLHVRLAGGKQLSWHTGESWKCSDGQQEKWLQPGFDDSAWQPAHVVGDFGMAPWGKLQTPATMATPGPIASADLQRFRQLKATAIRGGTGGVPAPILREPRPGENWPDALVFVGGDCSLYRPPARSGDSRDSLSVTIFNPHHGRAYPEHDLPAPVKVGRMLMALRPARPGIEPQVLLDAGAGAVGPPAVSYDGRWIFFPMAKAGDAFFHIYRIPATGGPPEQLTDGPFHDTDPCELPDGRLVFSSTRLGTFEEYHNPPSRGLFTLGPNGKILPLAHTMQFDNEPKVLADGRLLMLRTDNFFDRGKVETMLHGVFPDGSGGYTEFGLDQGPEYGNRLRAFNAGSAAPMPDGRVAWVDGTSVLIARPGEPAANWRRLDIAAADVTALPNGNLVCTVAGGKSSPGDWPFRTLALLDPAAAEPEMVLIHQSTGAALHSPVHLGPRPRPPELSQRVDPVAADQPGQTGVFYCQNVRLTQNRTAGWEHVRAIRVLAGYGLTLRSSHSYLVHAGSEVVELGTVPLAPDGSFAVEVPADTAIALQAVDAEGRSELNQMSWMTVRPGETRGCVGCHQPRQSAPPPLSPGGVLQALSVPPLKLTGRGDPPRFRGNNAAVTGLMELQFDRFREIAGINNLGRAGSPDATGRDEIAALTADLTSDNPERQHAAAQRAALARDPLTAPALAACLQSDDREVRVAAALALAACGTRESITPLKSALADPDPLVAQASAIALENLRGTPLNGFNPFVTAGQRRIDHGSESPGDETWLKQRLLELAGDDRDKTRRAAVTLAHCGGPPAAPAIREKFLAMRETNPFPAWRADHSHRGDGTRFNSRDAVNPRALQEVTRALAIAGDPLVPLLAETAAAHLDPETGNLFLAESAVEALARIGTPAAESALLGLLPALPPYFTHSRWYGDHDALIACHAAPVHARIAAALDKLGSRGAAPHIPALVRMVPTDPDRALLPANDDFETLLGRVIRRSGQGDAVVNACLSLLGDPAAVNPDPRLIAALNDVHAAWAGRPCGEIRAAQILSLVVRDPALAPRVLTVFQRYRSRENTIQRVYDKGIPVVTELPVRHWVCFYLARTLGQLGNDCAVAALSESLDDKLAEAAGGRPDPLGPGVLFLHNDLTPCWRAAVAWALGRIGSPQASPALLRVLANMENATDTRYAAAVALGRLAKPSDRATLRELAGRTPEVSVRRALLEASGESAVK